MGFSCLDRENLFLARRSAEQDKSSDPCSAGLALLSICKRKSVSTLKGRHPWLLERRDGNGQMEDVVRRAAADDLTVQQELARGT